MGPAISHIDGRNSEFDEPKLGLKAKGELRESQLSSQDLTK